MWALQLKIPLSVHAFLEAKAKAKILEVCEKLSAHLMLL